MTKEIRCDCGAYFCATDHDAAHSAWRGDWLNVFIPV